MLTLPSGVGIVEVAPRDGLQSFGRWVDTATKVRMIDCLTDAGFPVIEVSSFASPKAVPHLKDAEEVFASINRKPGVVYRALVPNEHGAMRAVKAQVDEILGLMTLSEVYTRKNQNMSVDEAIDAGIASFNIADANFIPFVMALGMSFWCAYEGVIPEARVQYAVRRLHDAGVRRFYLAGSVGMEDPAHVNRLFSSLTAQFSDASFGFHIHNLSGMAAGNIVAALDGGAVWLESAICGIGGGIAMPEQLGSVGNFPTEDLVSMLFDMDIKTGLDPAVVIDASLQIARMLGIEPKSFRAHGATRSEVTRIAGSTGQTP